MNSNQTTFWELQQHRLRYNDSADSIPHDRFRYTVHTSQPTQIQRDNPRFQGLSCCPTVSGSRSCTGSPGQYFVSTVCGTHRQLKTTVEQRAIGSLLRHLPCRSQTVTTLPAPDPNRRSLLLGGGTMRGVLLLVFFVLQLKGRSGSALDPIHLPGVLSTYLGPNLPTSVEPYLPNEGSTNLKEMLPTQWKVYLTLYQLGGLPT